MYSQIGLRYCLETSLLQLSVQHYARLQTVFHFAGDRKCPSAAGDQAFASELWGNGQGYARSITMGPCIGEAAKFPGTGMV
jgi:hypothetical protein